MEEYLRTYCEIDLKAIRENYINIKKKRVNHETRKRLRLFLRKKCIIVEVFVVSLHSKDKLSYI